MKKRIWLTLLVLVVVVIVGSRGSAFFEQRSSPTIVETVPLTTPQPQPESQEVKNELQVSIDILLGHIQKLNFQRYTTAERSRTRTYIISELRKFGWTPKLEKFPNGINVFAERQGTDSTTKAILIGAHYDTVAASPGADDNASGVAVLLEIARLFASHPTPRTLQLAFFDLEEAGLLGSKAFVTNTQRLEKLRGVIVMDMVGYACYTSGCQKYPVGLPVTPPSDKGDFLVAVGDTENLSLLNAFNNTDTTNLLNVLTLPIPLKGLLTPDTLRSDHAPFWYQGIGAVLVTDTANLRTPHYHQPSDVPKNIERSFFAGAAQIVVNATDTLLKSQQEEKGQGAGSKGENQDRACTPPRSSSLEGRGLYPCSALHSRWGEGLAPPAPCSLPPCLFRSIVHSQQLTTNINFFSLSVITYTFTKK